MSNKGKGGIEGANVVYQLTTIEVPLGGILSAKAEHIPYPTHTLSLSHQELRGVLRLHNIMHAIQAIAAEPREKGMFQHIFEEPGLNWGKSEKCFGNPLPLKDERCIIYER